MFVVRDDHRRSPITRRLRIPVIAGPGPGPPTSGTFFQTTAQKDVVGWNPSWAKHRCAEEIHR